MTPRSMFSIRAWGHQLLTEAFALFEAFCNGVAQCGEVAVTAAKGQLQLLGPQAKAEQGVIAINPYAAV